MDGSTWRSYRANVGPHERPPFLGEPTADPAPWVALGYTPLRRYTTVHSDHAAQIQRTRARDARMRAAGWRLETLSDFASFAAALDTFYAVSLDAFADNYLYTPLDRAAFGALYAPLQPLIVPELALVARAPDGAAAGYCFSYPDAANPALRQVVIKTLAVATAHRSQGLGGWLVGETHRTAEALGLTGGALHALMIAGNHSTTYARGSGRLVREYVLYEKTL